jgi:cardiolipin synthase A/B
VPAHDAAITRDRVSGRFADHEFASAKRCLELSQRPGSTAALVVGAGQYARAMPPILRRTRTAFVSLLLTAAVSAGCSVQAPSAGLGVRLAADSGAYQLIQEPDAGYAPIIGLISGAARSVRMTMYELNDPAAINALIDAHRRGVDVKVILDAAFRGRKTNADAFGQLTAAGVETKWAPNGVIYHQKTITVDDATSAVGTGNLTAQYYATSRDAWVLDTNPTDVAAIVATFDTDFAAPPSGHPPEASPAANLVWSPDARATFLRHIDQATHSVDVTSEELKDRAVLSALGKAARRGVSCRIVLTSNPAWDNAVAELSNAGCSVHLLPATDTGLYMHEKMLLTDDTSLIVGSQNISTTSLLENRELSLSLDTAGAPAVIAAVGSTFDNDYAAAPAAQQ